MTDRQTQILVADRNQMIIEALEEMFLELDGAIRVTKVTTFADALAIAMKEQPDLILLDSWMGSADPVSSVRQILECSPTSLLVVMTSRSEPDLEARLIRSGAVACHDKESIPAAAPEIMDMIRARG